MTAKERAVEIYRQHIALAAVDGRLFRKTVREQIMAETGCSESAASTHYNYAKNAMPIEGLGRQRPSVRVKTVSNGKGQHKTIVPDEQCYSVMEILPNGIVGRYRSFEAQGDASECFDEKVQAWPRCVWVLIQGLGPNSGDDYRLAHGEREVRRHEPQQQMMVDTALAV